LPFWRATLGLVRGCGRNTVLQNCRAGILHRGEPAEGSVVQLGGTPKPLSPTGFEIHGSSLRICAPSLALRVALSAAATAFASRYIDGGHGGRCPFGWHAIRGEGLWGLLVARARPPGAGV